MYVCVYKYNIAIDYSKIRFCIYIIMYMYKVV